MVTMKEVAALAGVSITTVSHVVNETRSVAPDTRERVLKAIEETGYTGDAIARSLVTGGTKSLGLAVSLVSHPYFAELIAAIEAEATDAGYTLVLIDTRGSAESEQAAVRMLRSRRVDGVLLTPTSGSAALPELRRLGVPTVLVDRLTVARDLDQVGPENVQATSALVRHVAELGHRRIGLVTGTPGLATTDERVLGYRLGLGRAGLAWDEDLVAGSLDPLLGRATAVVVGDHQALVDVLRTARARGVRIGADLALVTYDEVEWAELVDPPLTTMAQPVEEIGRTAVRLLLARIADPDRAPETIRLPPALRHRQSCGCPHSA
ncbi:LacI family DNA-binding transcriptional regulator [Saccharothrix algeriensis]|uniref:LacI family DNA-binding transcriptional regulator n=1 Tax=Saccharothrix algeriensis TaxID=173560 RepID=A0A8T8HRB0_9PSEU|nr:LacI family DNA-binding transcriptional regulator [Saccharothrix algeriensis]MBM7812356.1 LacI family transcriptional regulator [Saccharothrix algeriensis]QTR01122.1 LacI family DNA-binding transcriptional regulator [Saccharothrix algeriensis]